MLYNDYPNWPKVNEGTFDITLETWKAFEMLLATRYLPSKM